MASKNDKTSKTARVMNLLSKKPEPNSEEASQAPAAPAAPTPPIVTSMAPDVAVSAQIKNALEDALESEVPQQTAPAPQPKPAPVQEVEPAPQPQPAPVQEAAPAPQPEPVEEKPIRVEDFVTMDEPAKPEEAGEPEDFVEVEVPVDLDAPTQWKEPLQPVNPGYMNVMQVLVEEKAPKYVQMFGLCSCERCMEDVKALTLNNLPPKYVVVEQGDMIPRLTVYEGKFSSDITAQLLQACKIVMERPHHNRA